MAVCVVDCHDQFWRGGRCRLPGETRMESLQAHLDGCKCSAGDVDDWTVGDGSADPFDLSDVEVVEEAIERVAGWAVVARSDRRYGL